MQKWKDLPFVSGILVAVNVIVFMICTFTGDLLYNMGELGVAHILVEKEYIRILSAMFLHSDVHHIFNNMVILFFLGAMIEKEIGHFRYATIYFLSGVSGNLLSLTVRVMTHDPAVSIGASGGVFGMDGVLLALVLFSGRRIENVTVPRVFLMIAYSPYSGFVGANIDNAAHIGGLATGFLLGILVCIVDKHKKKQNKNGSERWSLEY